MLDCFAKARGFQQGHKHMAKRRKVKSGATESPQGEKGEGEDSAFCHDVP